MTSKRMGILLIALFALWSLAGSGSFVSQSNTPGDLTLGVSLAYAGDPDDYAAPTEGQVPDGDPDDYTDPVPEDEPSPTDEEEEEDEVKTLLEIALSVLLGIGGAVY